VSDEIPDETAPVDGGAKPLPPGRCGGCGYNIPRSAILPTTAGPSKHLIPGRPGVQGKLCGPVFTAWAYHFAFYWKAVGRPLGGYSDAPIETNTPIDSPPLIEEARAVLRANVKPRDPNTGAPIILPPDAIRVTIISFQMIAMR